MEFSRTDTDHERNLKLQILSIYNSKLDGREKRKKFIADHKLLDTKKHQEADRKRSRDERDLVQRMRLFARFQTPEEHEKFVENVLKTKRMRKEIAQLQFYRRMGIRSLAEAELYELDKRRIEFHKSEAAKDKKNTTSITSSLWPKYISNKNDRMKKSVEEPNVNEAGIVNKAKDASEQVMSKTLSESKADFLDISNAPGINLLSTKEIALCEKIRLLPQFYLEVKRELIQESLSQGFIEDGNSSSLVKIDIEKKGEVIQFMLSSGWIKVKN